MFARFLAHLICRTMEVGIALGVLCAAAALSTPAAMVP